jgi:hypothetical protein
MNRIISKVKNVKFELYIHTRSKKKCFAPAPETSKTADMYKSDIPKTQIDDEVEVVDEDQLHSNFINHFSSLTSRLLKIFPHQLLSLEFIFMVKVVPT